MTGPEPRPLLDTCRGGGPLCYECPAPPDQPCPTNAAPAVVSTDKGALARAIAGMIGRWYPQAAAADGGALLAECMVDGPLRDLIAARDQAVAAVGRARGVLDALDETAAETTLRPVVDATVVSRAIRRALDGKS